MSGTTKTTCAFIAFELFCLFVYLPSMLTEGMHFYLATIVATALLVFLVGYLLSLFLLKLRGALFHTQELPLSTALRQARYLISLFVASVALIVIKSTAYGLSYYFLSGALFICFGWYLSRHYHTHHLPIFLGFFAVIASCVLSFIVFVNNPAAIADFGLERVIFALRDFVGDSSFFSLASAITWFSWQIAHASRGAVDAPA